MFRLLQAHEEREPNDVLKTQSKRAQKRLIRQEARKEEADRSSRLTEASDHDQERQAVLQMYEELYLQGDVDSSVLEDDSLLRDIAAQLQRVRLHPAGPAAHGSGGGGESDGCGHEALGFVGRSDLLHVRRHVDSPPGPGPGSGPGPGRSPDGRAGHWLTRQVSAPPLCWPEPVPSGSPRSAAAAHPRGGGRAGASVLMRFGSGAGFFGSEAAATSTASGGQPGTPGTPACGAPGRPLPASGSRQQLLLQQQEQQQQQVGREWQWEEEEEFPELRPTVTAHSLACSGGGGGAARRQGCQVGERQQPCQQAHCGAHRCGHTHRRGTGGGIHAARHGAQHSGVKVLHTARPTGSATHGSHGHGNALLATRCCRPLPESLLSRWSSALRFAFSFIPVHIYDLKGGLHNGGGFGGRDDVSTTEFNLSFLWDLIDGGLCLRDDPLAAEGGDLAGPEPAAAAAIKRLVKTRYAGEDGPARGVSPEDMIAMMARAHKRQCKGATSAAGGGGGGAAAAAAAAPVDGDGDDDDGGGSDDEPHLYLDRDESRSWRRTVEWMKDSDWVLVKDTDGKHHKYRRWLPNGQIQTQTVCCSPSDALRGVRNLQADLARKDAQANSVIRSWRREERERRRRESKAAAAAQEGWE